MKPIRLFLCTVLALAGLSLLSFRTTAWAEDEGDRDLAQRLDRLEQQVHQLADRPQPSNQRPGSMMERPQGPMPTDGRMQTQACPSRRYPGCCILGTILIVLATIHVLLAIWVFGDIRKRGEGSGLFVVLALLAGIPGTALYLLARIGDRKAT